MNPAKVTATDYIDFLLATPKVCSATEAARVQPDRDPPPAHDAYTRLLHRLEPDSTTLWREVQGLVERRQGVLVLDDSTLDKPYAQKIDLVCRHWSGKHRRVVKGINLLSLLWTDGDRLYPCDYRLYDKVRDGLTKNDHFRTLLDAAHARGFVPRCVVFDGWYASLDNLKRLRQHGWRWLTRLPANRRVNPEGQGLRSLGEVGVAAAGTVVHLEGYGLVKVFRIDAPNGDTQYWATSDQAMTEVERLHDAEVAWGIEEYHRGLKQFCNVERAQVRAGRAQRNHIGCAIRGFVRLEYHRFTTGWSWFEAKWRVIRDAVRAYLAQPLYQLPAIA
jgi:putative transposase